ncbi:MAG: hypothetical protein N3E49_08480 [Bacteroidia bacterium]|nr:hypothetical protein [Bacteroidia bacterium]
MQPPYLTKLGRQPILLVALIFFSACSDSFEGSIRYETSLSGEGAEILEPLLRAQRLGFILYQKGDHLRVEYPDRIIIVRYDQDSAFVIFPQDSSFIGFELSRGDSLPTLSMQALPEKRQIVGYDCIAKRVEYAADGKSYALTFWEAPALRPSMLAREKLPILPLGVRIEGFPLRLESSILGQSLTFIYEAVWVDRKRLSDDLFIVPLDFRKAK